MRAQTSPQPTVLPAPKRFLQGGGAQRTQRTQNGSGLAPPLDVILPPAARDTQANITVKRLHAHKKQNSLLGCGNYAHENLSMYQI